MAATPQIEPSPLTEAVERMEAALGRGDWTAAAAFFTDDVSYRVGHRPPVTGIAGIRAYLEWQNQRVQWTGHDLAMMFSRGDTAIFEVVSHFVRRSDGSGLKLPCTDIYRFRDGRIADWRVYADLTVFDD